MKPLLFVLLLLVVLAAAALIVLRKDGLLRGAVSGPWPFYAKRPLSQPEQVLYHRLVAALPAHVVLAQVQVSRVLGVKKGFDFRVWNNRVHQLSYDFVVCAKDFTVLAAIELDDRSHEGAGRAERDRRKDKATLDAGIRLLRWHVKAMPDLSAIRRTFSEQPLGDAQQTASASRRESEAKLSVQHHA